MSCSSGPTVVTNGLVLEYDMYNTKKSFKGAPTTNLTTTPTNLSAWNFGVGASGTPNAAIAPDGTMTATLYSKAASNNNGFCRPATRYDGANTYSFSVYIKQANWAFIGVRLAGGAMPSATAGSTHAVFSFATGTFTYSPTDYSTVYVEKCEAGWYRIGVTRTLISPEIDSGWQTGICTCATATSGPESWDSTAAGPTSFYAWGAQYEVQPYVTPYTSSNRTNTQNIVDLTGQTALTAASLTYAANNTFSFDGLAGAVTTAGSLPILTFGIGDHSCGVWFKTTSTSGGLIGKGTWSLNAWGSYISANALRFEMKDTVNGVATSSVVINDNAWHYVCATYNRAGNLSVYTDGNLSSSTSMSPVAGFNISNSNQFSIGYSGGPGFVSGSISNAHVYNRALSAAEVTQNFNATRKRYGL